MNNAINSSRGIPRDVISPTHPPTSSKALEAVLQQKVRQGERIEILQRRLKKTYKTLLRNFKRLENLRSPEDTNYIAVKSYFVQLINDENELKSLGVHIKLTIASMHRDVQDMLVEKLNIDESI